MSDIALTGVSGWTTIPVAFSTGGGNFSVTNSAPDPYSPLDFPTAATTAGATALGGAY